MLAVDNFENWKHITEEEKKSLIIPNPKLPPVNVVPSSLLIESLTA